MRGGDTGKPHEAGSLDCMARMRNWLARFAGGEEGQSRCGQASGNEQVTVRLDRYGLLTTEGDAAAWRLNTRRDLLHQNNEHCAHSSSPKGSESELGNTLIGQVKDWPASLTAQPVTMPAEMAPECKAEVSARAWDCQPCDIPP